MEDVRVRAFLTVSDGCGSAMGCSFDDGYSWGSGWGCGWSSGSGSDSGDGSSSSFDEDWYVNLDMGEGYGDGSSSGWGSGSRFGDGYGCGYGWSYGIKRFCGNTVYLIDGVQTIIYHIKCNVAKGAILKGDMTLAPCFIVKQDNLFAHGETLDKAMSALRDKLFEDMPEDERIKAFIAEHPELNKLYPCHDLYDWHHRLTGSCDIGRKQFAADHGIDIDAEERTVAEFIALTRNAYGGEIIKRLEEEYELRCV